MKEIVIKNPTRIVDTHDSEGYPRGLSVRVETPDGEFDAYWEHGGEYGCVHLRPAGDEGYDHSGLCRNPVLIASIECYDNTVHGDWPQGAEVPVLPESTAVLFLKAAGIPNDDWKTFNDLLSRF